MRVFTSNSIYFVTGEEFSLGRSDEEIVEAVLSGGVKVIQLRDKRISRSALRKKATRLRKLTHHYQALLIINDDPELALEVEADGVHLGQEDKPVLDVRKLSYRGRQGEDLIVGLSTHNLQEIENAYGIDYVNLGPVFPTQTKENYYPPVVSLTTSHSFGKNQKNDRDPYALLRKMISLCHLRQIPFTVMGGIKEEHIPILTQLGVTHFAMITAITQHPFPRKYVAHLIQEVRNHLVISSNRNFEEKPIFNLHL